MTSINRQVHYFWPQIFLLMYTRTWPQTHILVFQRMLITTILIQRQALQVKKTRMFIFSNLSYGLCCCFPSKNRLLSTINSTKMCLTILSIFLCIFMVAGIIIVSLTAPERNGIFSLILFMLYSTHKMILFFMLKLF